MGIELKTFKLPKQNDEKINILKIKMMKKRMF